MTRRPTPTADDLAFFGAHDKQFPRSPLAESIKKRMTIERAVIRKAAKDLLAAGLQLRVHDGEDYATPKTSDIAVVMEGIMSVDEENLYVYGPGEKQVRTIFLVYGNEGWTVIADNSCSLEELLTGASALADELSAFA